MTGSTQSVSKARQLRKFGIVAVLASTAIAVLIATDAVTPYPTPKTAYLVCAVIGCVGLLQLAYSVAVARHC